MKQYIYIYVSSGLPNGWTVWAEIFLWTLICSIGGHKLKKFNLIRSNIVILA